MPELTKESVIENPLDAEGNPLKLRDRVYTYDVLTKRRDNYKSSFVKVFGYLLKVKGEWSVNYDDGETYIVHDFGSIWKAD